jgi:hypothetical protein
LKAAEEEYHADLHKNAESDNPEPDYGAIDMHCCIYTNKSSAYSCAVISTATEILGYACAPTCSLLLVLM